MSHNGEHRFDEKRRRQVVSRIDKDPRLRSASFKRKDASIKSAELGLHSWARENRYGEPIGQTARPHTQQDSGKPLTTWICQSADVAIAPPLPAASANAPSSLIFMRTFLMQRHCVAPLGTTVAPGEMALSA